MQKNCMFTVQDMFYRIIRRLCVRSYWLAIHT